LVFPVQCSANVSRAWFEYLSNKRTYTASYIGLRMTSVRRNLTSRDSN